MKNNTTASATATPAATAKKTNNIGSTILALSGMILRTCGKTPTSKQVGCQVALEKNNILRPIEDRKATGKNLTEKAFRRFTRLSKSENAEIAKGASKVIKLANELFVRGKKIAAYKAELSLQSPEETPVEVTANA